MDKTLCCLVLAARHYSRFVDVYAAIANGDDVAVDWPAEDNVQEEDMPVDEDDEHDAPLDRELLAKFKDLTDSEKKIGNAPATGQLSL